MIIRIRKKHLRKINPLLVCVLALEFLFPQHTLLAAQNINVVPSETVIQEAEAEIVTPDDIISAEGSAESFVSALFPKVADRKVIRTLRVTATAYSSTPDQTDASPFIAASGARVFDGMVAANFLPFGTKIRIPDMYGDKQFVVLDRMNKRYSNRVDIWMTSRAKALKFGVRTIRIEVLK